MRPIKRKGRKIISFRGNNKTNLIKSKNEKNRIGIGRRGSIVLGAAHIGVLRVLEEMEVEISFIAGTSIGAFVGALYSRGGSVQSNSIKNYL